MSLYLHPTFERGPPKDKAAAAVAKNVAKAALERAIDALEKDDEKKAFVLLNLALKALS